MELKVKLPDEFVAGLERLGVTPEEYVQVIVNDALRLGAARERETRPADIAIFRQKRAERREVERAHAGQEAAELQILRREAVERMTLVMEALQATINQPEIGQTGGH